MGSLFKKTNTASRSASKSSKKPSEISKIMTLIQAEQELQERIYAEIGKHFYEKEKNNSEMNEPFIQLFSEIAESNNKTELYQSEILKIKNVKHCHKCGRECSPDSVFCAGCGTQLPQEEKAIVDNHCVKCGAELAPDDAFCFNCGSKIEK